MEIENVFVSFVHESFGSIDVKISRGIPIKKTIFSLFDAISRPVPENLSFYVKAVSRDKLLFPNSTLEEFDIFDGETLKLL